MAEDDALAAFQAEIAGLEEAEEDPEEKSFVDDDGTAYVWDAAARKFIPEGQDRAAAAVPPPISWSEADMMMPDDDDVAPMPSLKEVKRAMARDRDGDDLGSIPGGGNDGGGGTAAVGGGKGHGAAEGAHRGGGGNGGKGGKGGGGRRRRRWGGAQRGC